MNEHPLYVVVANMMITIGRFDSIRAIARVGVDRWRARALETSTEAAPRWMGGWENVF